MPNLHSLFIAIVRKAWWILPLLVLLLQLPFISSDPDVRLSHSRDAQSDEGLNTSQVRNFINYGDINAWECDNLIKTPLFNLMVLPPMALFGTYREVARGAVMVFIFVLLTILFSFKPYRPILALLMPVLFLQFHIFQYTHLSLSEMPAIVCIIASIMAWGRYAMPESETGRLKWLMAAILFSSMSWYMKIQFAYILPLIPLSTIILWLTHRSHRKDVSRFFISLSILTGIVLFFVLLYLSLWYLPLQKAWTYIMQNQTAARFPIWKYQGEVIEYNFNLYFLNERVAPLLVLFILSIPLAIILLFRQTRSVFALLVIPAGLWVLLEVHKVFMHHVPGRYLVSSFAAMGFFSTITWIELGRRYLPPLHELFVKYKSVMNRGFIAVIILTVIIGFNLYGYADMLQKRRYDMYDLNLYLRHLSVGKATAVGAWAPALTWGTDIKAIPVWKDFLNDKQILSTFHPRIIFSEPEEQESEQAFKHDNINIVSIADSSKQTMPGNKWTVILYWINPDSLSRHTY